LVISLVGGLTAPIMAIIAGIIFTSLKQDNTAELEEWKKKRKSAWTRFQSKNALSLADVTVTRQLPTGDDRRDSDATVTRQSMTQSDILERLATAGDKYSGDNAVSDFMEAYSLPSSNRRTVQRAFNKWEGA
jgi:hypothetical protein